MPAFQPRQNTSTIDITHANEFAVFAESALRIVEQDVGFERTTLDHAKPQRAETSPDFPNLAWESQLNFDFDLQSDTLVHRQ